MNDRRGSATDKPDFSAGWFSRPRLITLLWTAAVIALAAMAYMGAVGWDAKGYWKAIQSVHHHSDPYAEDIVVLQEFHERVATNPAEPRPFVYVYSPLTFPLLRALGVFPGWFVGLFYAVAVAVGAAIQLWAGFQMADERERRWLVFALPAVAFFPGLVTDDVILSGNVAYLLYGGILLGATAGWKRGQWTWYYIAVLIASIFKTPFLAFLAFPVLIDARQWIRSGMTAVAGVLIFAVQARIWPGLFREYLKSLLLVFDWLHDFGFGPASVLGLYLWRRGRPTATPTTVLFVICAGVIGIVLLVLAGRVRKWNLPREGWVPVAFVGTALLNPRVMKYDLAALTVPMLLIGARVLRMWWNSGRPGTGNPTAVRPSPLARIQILAGSISFFLIPNIITTVGPSWFPAEFLVLATIFVMGIFWLYQLRAAGQPILETLPPD
ncbi:MAG: hypothetical protein WA741_14955 [Candidatus Sulfotelmatobacter sp.]